MIRHRRSIPALLVAGMLVLAGCGAEVSSELEVSEDLSGTRTIVAAIAENDVEELSGGIEATEEALETHVPEQLSFDGIAEAGSTEETEDEAEASEASDGYQATFTLEFSDVEDYQTKAQSLLDAGETETTAEIEMVNAEGPLLSGFTLDENFSGIDLLGWVPQALLDEGVVTEDQSESVLANSGEGRVVVENEDSDNSADGADSADRDSYDSYEPFSVDQADDYRFDRVDVRMTDDGAAVDFTAAYDWDDTEAAREAGQAYLEDTGVGELSGEDGSWTVTLDGSAPLQDQLRELLSSPELQLSVEESADTERAVLVTTVTGSGFTCPEVCANAPSFSVDTSGSLKADAGQASGEEFELTYEQTVPVEEITIDTQMGLSGSVAQTYRYTVAAEHADAFGEQLQTVFAPPEGTGSVDTESVDHGTVYVATLDAVDAEELNSTLEEYLPGSSVSLSGYEGFTVWPNYTLDVDAYGVEQLGVTPTQTLSLPMMHSADEEYSRGITDDGEITSDQSAYSASASGPSLAGLLLIGGIVLLVIVVVVLILVFRRRIAASFRTVQWQPEAHFEGISDRFAAVGVESSDDAIWQDNFTEAKLQ